MTWFKQTHDVCEKMLVKQMYTFFSRFAINAAASLKRWFFSRLNFFLRVCQPVCES